jgi:hypothetical protein
MSEQNSASAKAGKAAQNSVQIFSFEAARAAKKKNTVYERWIAYYNKQEHQDLLDALVYEHENNFPLRASADELDQLRHKALIQVLQERAQSDFLRNLLAEIDAKKVH